MTKRYVRSSFSPPFRVSSSSDHPSMTKQSFRDECDINHIMGRYLRSGQVDHISVHGPQYGFCTGESFHDCMETVRKAEQMFADLPSSTRKRFNNSPQSFLEFVQDEKNLPEMRDLGLALPAKPAAAAPAAAGAIAPIAPSSSPGPSSVPAASSTPP